MFAEAHPEIDACGLVAAVVLSQAGAR